MNKVIVWAAIFLSSTSPVFALDPWDLIPEEDRLHFKKIVDRNISFRAEEDFPSDNGKLSPDLTETIYVQDERVTADLLIPFMRTLLTAFSKNNVIKYMDFYDVMIQTHHKLYANSQALNTLHISFYLGCMVELKQIRFENSSYKPQIGSTIDNAIAIFAFSISTGRLIKNQKVNKAPNKQIPKKRIEELTFAIPGAPVRKRTKSD
jgi:hypothetical protein